MGGWNGCEINRERIVVTETAVQEKKSRVTPRAKCRRSTKHI